MRPSFVSERTEELQMSSSSCIHPCITQEEKETILPRLLTESVILSYGSCCPLLAWAGQSCI